MCECVSVWLSVCVNDSVCGCVGVGGSTGECAAVICAVTCMAT